MNSTNIENGYFVFQPDILFDKRGTGISALDCVNSGLDEIVNHSNVDASRLGLTGHSLGGYETNFIATHSKRFAAYVSGSSLGDIPHFYFSFSDLFNVANFAESFRIVALLLTISDVILSEVTSSSR